jgi:glycosyltransferase involved in cell wall biosynthesis
MLYICIPAYNEAPTVGVLLWRIQKVFQEFAREYELLVYDDGSSDATQEILAGYSEVLPLTVLGGPSHKGYAVALEELVRTVVGRCRYVRRDAVIFMQGDFTDQPEQIPELVRRFEGGADVVMAAADPSIMPPIAVRRFRRFAPWLLRPFVSVPGVQDPFGLFRIVRVSVLKDAIRASGDGPLVHGEGWGTNVDLLLASLPQARRVEVLQVAPRYDLRPRDSRVRPFADALRLYRFGRWARGGREKSRPVVQESAGA